MILKHKTRSTPWTLPVVPKHTPLPQEEKPAVVYTTWTNLKHHVEGMKPGTREYLLKSCSHTKFQNKQNSSLEREVKSAANSGVGKEPVSLLLCPGLVPDSAGVCQEGLPFLIFANLAVVHLAIMSFPFKWKLHLPSKQEGKKFYTTLTLYQVLLDSHRYTGGMLYLSLLGARTWKNNSKEKLIPPVL